MSSKPKSETEETEFSPKKDALFKITESVRTGLENLATPGKTHDEHSLQLETEKVNERMLMLSFLAVSIPLLGAIIAPIVMGIVFFFVSTCRRFWEENPRFWEEGRKIGGNRRKMRKFERNSRKPGGKEEERGERVTAKRWEKSTPQAQKKKF